MLKFQRKRNRTLCEPHPNACPPGKSLVGLSSPLRKNIPLPAFPKSSLEPPPSCSTEGRLAIVTNAGRDALDADGAFDE
jgi:hypothetical protein